MLPTLDFGEQPCGPRVLGTNLQNVLQRLARLPERPILGVLPRQPEPALDLRFAARAFDLRPQAERLRVPRFQFQGLLDFLQRQRIFLHFEPAARRFEQSADALLSHRRVNPHPQQLQFRVEVALRLEFVDDLQGELRIALGQRGLGSLDSRRQAGGVEVFDRLAAMRLLQALGELSKPSRSDATAAWPWPCESRG